MRLLYSEINKYSDALKYLRQSLRIFTKLNEKIYISSILNSMAEIYIRVKSFSKALDSLKKSEHHARSINNHQQLKKCYRLFSVLYETVNIPKKALRYHKLYHETFKIVSNEEINGQISILRKELEAEKKLKKIELIKKNAELLKIKQAKSHITKLAMSIGIVLICFIFILIFILRRRKKNN